MSNKTTMSFIQVDPDLLKKQSTVSEIKKSLLHSLREFANDPMLTPEKADVKTFKAVGKKFGIDYRTARDLLTNVKNPNWKVIEDIKKNLNAIILRKVSNVYEYVESISLDSVTAFLLDYFPKAGEKVYKNADKIENAFKVIKRDNFGLPKSNEDKLSFLRNFTEKDFIENFNQKDIYLYHGVLPLFWYEKMPKDIRQQHLERKQVSCFVVVLMDHGKNVNYQPNWGSFFQKDNAK